MDKDDKRQGEVIYRLQATGEASTQLNGQTKIKHSLNKKKKNHQVIIMK